MTMPPLADDPEASRPYFRRLRELARAHGLPELSMGTSQDYRVAVEEGATMIRVGSVLWDGDSAARALAFGAARRVTISGAVGFADLWNRTLVYFGIAEEDEYWDEDGYATNEELERTYNDRPNVRRLPRRAREDYDDWTDSDAAAAHTDVVPHEPPRTRGKPRNGGTPASGARPCSLARAASRPRRRRTSAST